MKSQKLTVSSLGKRLKSIRDAMDNTVIVTVGLKKTGEVDILDVQNTFAANKDKSPKNIDNSDQQQIPVEMEVKPSYIG